MTLAARYALPAFIERGKAATLSAPVASSAQVALEPTSATFALLDSSGDEVVATTAATVSGSSVTYALGAGALTSKSVPASHWREVWTLTIGAVVEVIERPAYLVRVAPVMLLTQADLYRLHSSWTNYIPVGSTTWNDKIEESWVQLIGRLISDSILPQQVLSQWALRTPHLHLAASLVARELREHGAEAYASLADDYDRMYQRGYDRLRVIKDVNEDGNADSDDAQGVGLLYLSNLPTSSSWLP